MSWLIRVWTWIRQRLGLGEPPAGAGVHARPGPKGPAPLAGAVALKEPHE
ncbi:MAG TPA: hypothetical protein VD973_25875 [Symbiobacteriaceae bacterium]|jgi:hypothetical protein|nr:hypothetical protein [Symbiobacteriaceae bacterium]